MKHLKKVQEMKEKLDYTVCDKCGRVVKEKDLENEIVNISHTFGFGSKRDGTNISFDVCEGCFMDMIIEVGYEEKKVSLWGE